MANQGRVLTRSERELIELIADRAACMTEKDKSSGSWRNLWASLMSGLAVCHLFIVELDLEGLSQATLYDIAHDVYGIRKNLDSENRVLKGFFLPRYAKNS